MWFVAVRQWITCQWGHQPDDEYWHVKSDGQPEVTFKDGDVLVYTLRKYQNDEGYTSYMTVIWRWPTYKVRSITFHWHPDGDEGGNQSSETPV